MDLIDALADRATRKHVPPHNLKRFQDQLDQARGQTRAAPAQHWPVLDSGQDQYRK